MAKTKDRSQDGASNKRKADVEDAAQSNTKKARRDPPTAFVKLPHSPGGSLHAPPKTAEDALAKREKKARRKRNIQERLEEQAQSSAGIAVPSSTPAVHHDEAHEKATRREQKRARKADGNAQNAVVVKKVGTAPSKAVQTPDGPTRPKATQTDKTVAVANPEKPKSEWSLSTPIAGRFIQQDPVFARDPGTKEEVLITANQRMVQVLSIETSLPLASLPAEDGQTLQCFALGFDDGTIRVAYDDGRVAEWDWISDAPPTTVAALDTEIRAMACATSSLDVEEQSFYLNRQGELATIYQGNSSLHTSTHELQSLQVLGDAEFVVAHGSTALLLGMKKDKQRADSDFVFVELPMEKGITCVNARITTADPRDVKRRPTLSLAVGDVEGQIHLFNDITSVFAQKGQASLPSPRILHWHREAVSAVKFSQDGNYLISGGRETVLVLWQLETGKKQFLPHLTSEIERIVVSPEGDKYAVQMGDNSIMVLSTSELKPVANFAGLQLAGPMPDSLSDDAVWIAMSPEQSVAAVLHPNNASQLLLTVPASQPKSYTDAAAARPFLQTFDLRTSRHVTRQALARNNVTDFNLGPEKTPVAPPDVPHLSISNDGQWLATVDEWMPPASDLQHLIRDEDTEIDEERLKRREVYLKIWRWDDIAALWTLSTRVDAPHHRAAEGLQGAGKVYKLIADPASTGFATVGEDGCVKVWEPKTRVQHGAVTKGQDNAEVVDWSCRRSVELPRQVERADSPVDDYGTEIVGPSGACLAYSADGSILAASQSFDASAEQPLVHLVDTATGDIKAHKAGPAHAPLECIGFLDRYFIAITDRALCVWDLVTDSLRYRHNIPQGGEPMLAINHTEGTFAIVVGSRVGVYKPTVSHPVYKTDCGGAVAAIMAAGKGSRGYTLLFEDATVRTLSPTNAAIDLRIALSVTDEAVAVVEPQPATEGTATTADVEMTDALGPPASKPESEQGLLLLADALADDRPVVRPEQLAQLFDVGPSVAMPPVKDMFEAVVGMFGRRPRTGMVEA
ncbi:hypothetical protein LTR85_003241 [Meristemomyces frigidus]|nr:hypothetical protein LTR85_003241 [Meristemomyces frigidus]